MRSAASFDHVAQCLMNYPEQPCQQLAAAAAAAAAGMEQVPVGMQRRGVLWQGVQVGLRVVVVRQRLLRLLMLLRRGQRRKGCPPGPLPGLQVAAVRRREGVWSQVLCLLLLLLQLARKQRVTRLRVQGHRLLCCHPPASAAAAASLQWLASFGRRGWAGGGAKGGQMQQGGVRAVACAGGEPHPGLGAWPVLDH